MEQVLLSAGWYKYKQCRCGGTLKKKYRHPSYPSKEYWIYPNRGTWEFRISRTVNTSNLGENTLREHLEVLS